VWTPAFACPTCAIPLSAVWCLRCGRKYEAVDDIWRFLTPQRREWLEPFVQQYRAVRARDGYRQPSPEYYRQLPSVDAGDPDAGVWRIRRETYRNLLRHVFAAAPQSIRVLDLGAGNGWLSHRLAELGHHPVAVDVVDDEMDGLRAARHFTSEFPRVQADFGELPFAPSQFDVAVFNASLHYAGDAMVALSHARQMLVPGGSLVVMDSPMFHADADGRAMNHAKARRFESSYGIATAIEPGIGFVTFGALERAAAALQMQQMFVPSRGPLAWRVRRQFARLRLRRAPAAFGLWVAR